VDLTVNTVLGAVSAVLLALSAGVLSQVWGEIKDLRKSRHDHASLLSAHEVKLTVHDRELEEIKERVFAMGE
jgi:hypothetical protein